MKKLGVSAKYFEGWNRVVVFVHHVIELRGAVLEPGWWMHADDLAEPTVELAGGELLVAALVYFECQLKQLGHVLAGDGAGNNQWCPWHKGKFNNS